MLASHKHIPWAFTLWESRWNHVSRMSNCVAWNKDLMEQFVASLLYLAITVGEPLRIIVRRKRVLICMCSMEVAFCMHFVPHLAPTWRVWNYIRFSCFGHMLSDRLIHVHARHHGDYSLVVCVTANQGSLREQVPIYSTVRRVRNKTLTVHSDILINTI